MNLKELKDALFARGAAVGFEEMEIYSQQSEKFSCNIFQGELDECTIAGNGGISFRGRLAGKMGYAYTEKLDESAVDLLLAGALAGAQVVDNDEHEPMCDGTGEYPQTQFFAQALGEVSAAEKIKLARQLEARCLALDPRVSMVDFCQVGSEATERFIANTRGLERSDRSNIAYAMLSVVVRGGEETKSAHKVKVTRNFGDFEAEAMARGVVSEAVSYLGAKPVQSGKYPVLLRGDAAASLLATYARIFYASQVQKGKSLLKGKLGAKIAADPVTILDDPLLPGGAESRGFDSEGTPSRPLTVVEKGVLRSFLHNQKSAAVDGVASTGHGHKPSYKGAVGIAPSNLYVKPGTRPLADLVKATGEGLLVTGLQGLHSGANPISGDFSLMAYGYLIKGGEVDRSVNQITIAGNFYDLLGAILEIGNDLEFEPQNEGYIGSPSLRIKELAVSGE